MSKVADFLVKRRIIIMVFMFGMTILFACMIPRVSVNTDMTKYLSDDSNMKQGIDLMEEEFPNLSSTNEIRVMFTGLEDSEKEEIASRLEQIEYVDSVSYDKDDEDYNNGDYTLYCVNTEYDFNTDEEASILEKIDKEFADYTFIREETNNTHTNLPFSIIAAALTILMIILFAMSSSWVEPILFIVVIGCAVVLNMGTNIFKGTVSETTFSIAAILQLVLSMDYSIIIMNRYWQELPFAESPAEAMKHTLKNAFMSVTSSAFTTFVGLLMLVFMSFKIGPDLGIVLAKGVIFSLLCVFTILPGLILIFHNAIVKTKKPVLPIPTAKLAKLSYRGRIPLTIGFIAILVGTYFMQTLTGISFSTTAESKIDSVFPAKNSVVVLYNNEDEENIESLSDSMEDDEKVSSIYSYPTTLGKECTAEKMLDMTEDMGSDMDIETYMIKLMYYRYYRGDDLPSIKVADLLNFIADEVVTNDSFSEYMDSEVTENISKIKKFADKDALTKKMSISELADFFDMDEDDLTQMFILYYKDNDEVATEKMTLKKFVQFLKNDILTDETYAGMIDSSMADKIDTFATFTDVDKIQTPLTYEEAANLMGIDASQLKLLYMYYYAQQDSYTPSAMTLSEFVSFLQTSVLTNSSFSGAIDSASAAKLSQMAAYTDASAIQSPLSAAQMATFMNMTEAQVTSVYLMYYGEQQVEDTTMTIDQFLSFLLANETYTENIDAETLQNMQAMNSLFNLVLSGQELSAAELSAMFGEEASEQLSQMNEIIQMVESQTPFTYSQMADVFGMDENQAKQLYCMYAGASVENPTMSVYELVNYLLSNQTISATFDASQISSLGMVKQLMDLVISNQALGYNDMANLLGMDAASMKTLYALHDSYGDTSTWKLTLQQLVGFIIENEEQFAASLGSNASNLALLQKIMKGTVAGTAYSYDELANILGMDASDLKQLYLLYQTKHGDTSDWGTSPQKFVSFIQDSIMTNDDYKDAFDDEQSKELESASKLIDAIVADKPYSVAQTYSLLKDLTDSMGENDLVLLYTYYGSVYDYDKTWTMSIQELFKYLNEDLFEDEAFADLIDEDMKSDVSGMQDDLDEAVNSLKGPNYSIMSISTIYGAESDDTFAFFKKLHEACDDKLSGDYYIIGSSAMYYEMSQNFKHEMIMMTLLTAISIFIIVLISFGNLAVPTLLVLLVQTAVFATVSVSYLRGYAINYLAYLIVQCILMGATIDYAILMTNNYRESRKSFDIKDSLARTYAASMHTILTSGLIMILVTGILGFAVSDPNIGPICQTISIGTAAAVILITFILPAMLALFDRLVCGKKAAN